jgi:phenylpyruvate tautomerase PptA (4-oxalocrotonate tautomerase family)
MTTRKVVGAVVAPPPPASGAKSNEIVRKVTEAIRAMPNEGPEPYYIIIEETPLRIISKSIQEMTRTRDWKEVRLGLLDVVDGLKKIFKEAEYVSLEEKEALVEELTDRRKANTRQPSH